MVILTNRKRIATVFNSLRNNIRREACYQKKNKWTFLKELPLDNLGERVLGPFMSIADFDVVVDLCVEFSYMWVRRGRGAERVSFNNESFGDLSVVYVGQKGS